MVLLNKSLAIKNQIDIATNIIEELPKLECDVRRMKQILTNLITNALKYSPANTTITITAKYLTKEKQIYIEVKDEGIGMNDDEIKMALLGNGEDIDKSELNKEFDSHGIGMPIVKRLVELHNGRLEIESAKRMGTKIKLYFNSLDKRKSEDRLTKQTINKKILIVDDSPVNLKITSTILKRVGYAVNYVENGADAISILDQENFDLILMDGEMPIMDGYQATREIREGNSFKNFKNYKNIPIIALMGNSDHETIGKIQDCGMNGHLSKSSSAKEILDVVESFLSIS
jgi:CheY-like chemotaxis protein/anti-sigma regulatory factor (Ser/Thr protein kinase)